MVHGPITTIISVGVMPVKEQTLVIRLRDKLISVIAGQPELLRMALKVYGKIMEK